MKKKLIRCILTTLSIACIGTWILWGNIALETNEFEVRSDRIPETFSGFRIAQISDLHNAEFGRENGKLLQKLADASPDIIVITGDMIDSRRTNVEVALNFARLALDIAPVYYVSGNHEARISEYEDLKAGLIEMGVVVLENQKAQLDREGESITLMGIADPSFLTGYLLGDAGSVAKVSIEALQSGTTNYTILLSHRPELFDTYVAAGIDLVFSGHAHGGQFRLPILGGLIAPNQGLFPVYDSGLFVNEKTNMVVSRGIGNSIVPIRFNNRPEIVLVTLNRT